MADATQRRDVNNLVVGNGLAYTVKSLESVIELAASASGTSINFGRIPSNARILGFSRVSADDLATSGSPTLDIGLAPVNGNITADPDALNDGLAVSSALSNTAVIKDKANIGKKAWEFVSGVTADPGGAFEITGTIKDAATTATGTIALEVLYTID